MDASGPPDIVVVAGGTAPSRSIVVPSSTFVVAADSGVALAQALGLRVDVAVGDFDSLDADLVARLDDLADEVRRHPVDKNATDLELALAVAVERSPARVLVVGLEGGRPDHALANVLVAAAPAFASLDVELVLDRGEAWVVRDRLVGAWPAGTTVSMLPLHGAANVSIDSVRWPLDHVTLAPGTTRGISNSTTAEGATTVTVHDGVVICIVPRIVPQSVPLTTESNP
ncbi:MAG: thiamine diphosphokinase [Acidimicrobiales bacterium]|nr:thiamine diphosphokinase [Acidimicrobiales bacterium]